MRIPDYQLYQELGICIGEGSSGEVSSPACEPRSGSVESWIKQIDEQPRVPSSWDNIGVRRLPRSVSWARECASRGSRIKIVGAQWNQKNVKIFKEK